MFLPLEIVFINTIWFDLQFLPCMLFYDLAESPTVNIWWIWWLIDDVCCVFILKLVTRPLWWPMLTVRIIDAISNQYLRIHYRANHAYWSNQSISTFNFVSILSFYFRFIIFPLGDCWFICISKSEIHFSLSVM